MIDLETKRATVADDIPDIGLDHGRRPGTQPAADALDAEIRSAGGPCRVPHHARRASAAGTRNAGRSGPGAGTAHAGRGARPGILFYMEGAAVDAYVAGRRRGRWDGWCSPSRKPGDAHAAGSRFRTTRLPAVNSTIADMVRRGYSIAHHGRRRHGAGAQRRHARPGTGRSRAARRPPPPPTTTGPTRAAPRPAAALDQRRG